MKDRIKGLIPYVVILVIVILIRSFVMTPVRVNGSSMNDSLDEGDILILNKLDKSYDRFDIVVVDNSLIGEEIIKRIIGVPGDKIEIKNGIVYINGEKLEDITEHEVDHDVMPITLNDNEYYVLGDNRSNSHDSSELGKISGDIIVGTVSLRIYPFNNIGLLSK